MKWQPLNLAAPEYAVPSEPPRACGLVYAGKRHLISGPPEAAKTLLALIVALEELRAGGGAAFVDFESGPAETRRLLEDLGATDDELAAVHYFEPDGPPDTEDIDYIVGAGVTVAIIDALAGAYDAAGLDDHKRGDIERFARSWIRPLWQRGVATVAIDHVVKNSENRGKFSIGSERKLGSVDIHLGLTAVRQLHRGANGLIRVSTHKDRPAHLTRPHAAEIDLRSNPADHRITWTIRPASATAAEPDAWRPTALMQRVSEYLERQTDAVPVTAIYDAVKGKRDYLRDAIAFLVGDGFATEQPGNRGSRLIRSTKRYREPAPTLSHPSPDGGDSHSVPVPPPLGGNGTGSLASDPPDEEDEARWRSLLDADFVPTDVDEATL